MSSPHHCCISPPPSTTFPLPRLHSSSFRRRQAARRAKEYWRCSPRCTLETVGPVFDPLGIQCKEQDSPLSSLFGVLSSPAFGSSSTRREKSSYNRGAAAAIEDSSIDIGDFFKGPLPGKFLKLLGYLILSWLGVYVPLGGVNREAFAGNLDLNSLLGTLDSFSGGGIGRLGICSLGIVPFINAQIMFQLLAQLYPKLQDLQRKEGEPGRKKVLEYTRYASVGFAIVQVCSFLKFLVYREQTFRTKFLMSSKQVNAISTFLAGLLDKLFIFILTLMTSAQSGS